MYLNGPKAFIEYSNAMDDVYNNIDDYNPKRERKILILFDEWLLLLWLMKNFRPWLKNYLLDAENWIFLLRLSQNLIFVSKGVRLNSALYLIMRIHDKRELQQITTNHSADIDYKNFTKIYRKCTSQPHSFLTIDTT